MWKCLLKLRDQAKEHVEYKIGNGQTASAWFDKWNGIGPLCQYIDSRDLYNARFSINASVADMIHNNQWVWENEWENLFPDLSQMPVPQLTDTNDKVFWKSNNGDLVQFSTKQAWIDYSDNQPEVTWKNLVWFSQCIPSHTFVVWMAVHGRLQTQDRLFQWNSDISMRCYFCNHVMDSHDHLFVQCDYAKEVWRHVRRIGYVNGVKQNWADTINSMVENHTNSIKSVVCRLVFNAVVYFLWQERNRRHFTKETRFASTLAGNVLDTVRTRLRSLRVIASPNVYRVAKEWDIQFNAL